MENEPWLTFENRGKNVGVYLCRLGERGGGHYVQFVFQRSDGIYLGRLIKVFLFVCFVLFLFFVFVVVVLFCFCCFCVCFGFFVCF